MTSTSPAFNHLHVNTMPPVDTLSSWGTLVLSIACNTLVFQATRTPNTKSSATAASGHVRAISASHSILVTILTIIALRQQHWQLSLDDPTPPRDVDGDGNLDDAANPMIQGRSRLANMITSWEAGYLLYDTWAMAYALPRTVGRSARPSPVMVTHHALIGAGLLYLQHYIARGKERGVRVILGLLLMNASNPLLHARWWARKTGRQSRFLDAAFLVAFAGVRFGSVAWILRQYGAYHRLGLVDVFGRLRTPCKVGTASLVGLNGVWWLWMCKNFAQRYVEKTKKRI
ncbi:TLC domain-containing protein [Emericellopsis atlantica]|uniref:TLC domain-containing protein n=1 Tax=Emericellopsis atlantica TaxID=2614577 RepID=A0A9P7ZFB9_9HYPO|nr:TLC domain-containing protein [Emericellopsis atlantica]KAG9251104.1 TLC domain-containing protein [Emericellopsis atlantica]